MARSKPRSRLSGLALLFSLGLTLLLGACFLESESPILTEEAAGPAAGAPTDISGAYRMGDKREDGKLVLRRKEGSRNAFIVEPGPDKAPFLVLAAPLRAHGTLLLQLEDTDKGRSVLIPARISAAGLTIYPQSELQSKPGSRNPFSFTSVYLWNKGF